MTTRFRDFFYDISQCLRVNRWVTKIFASYSKHGNLSYRILKRIVCPLPKGPGPNRWGRREVGFVLAKWAGQLIPTSPRPLRQAGAKPCRIAHDPGHEASFLVLSPLGPFPSGRVLPLDGKAMHAEAETPLYRFPPNGFPGLTTSGTRERAHHRSAAMARPSLGDRDAQDAAAEALFLGPLPGRYPLSAARSPSPAIPAGCRFVPARLDSATRNLRPFIRMNG